MIDPWIALGVNMVVMGVLGGLFQYAGYPRSSWQDYVSAVFILAIAAGGAAMLAWGLTRAWSG